MASAIAEILTHLEVLICIGLLLGGSWALADLREDFQAIESMRDVRAARVLLAGAHRTIVIRIVNFGLLLLLGLFSEYRPPQGVPSVVGRGILLLFTLLQSSVVVNELLTRHRTLAELMRSHAQRSKEP